MVAQTNEDVTDFLFQLSRTRAERWLHEEIYEECKTVIEEALRYSTRRPFENRFWLALPPQLRNRIVGSVLKT